MELKVRHFNFALKPLFWVCAVIHRLFNRGWRRVSDIKNHEKQHSFYQLPKPDVYDIIVDGKIIYRHYYGGSISDDAYIENNVTHFRKSERHKLPRF